MSRSKSFVQSLQELKTHSQRTNKDRKQELDDFAFLLLKNEFLTVPTMHLNSKGEEVQTKTWYWFPMRL